MPSNTAEERPAADAAVSDAVADLVADYDAEIDDADVLDLLAAPTREWWVDEFGAYVEENGGFFTPPQKEAIPNIREGTNTLVCSPTGSGKTLSAYCAILDDLFRRAAAADDGLDNEVHCLYVSPLKSLANDIQRNLEVPLEGIAERYADRGEDVEVRQAIRHGDTSDAERRAMLEETPHILNTTPETLAILLNSPRFREKLESVEYVVVDEIHALAESKRGTHLSVSLERLENLTETSPTRIGCSATVEPLDEVAEFLVGREEPGGEPREYDVVDTRFVRDFDLQLHCPAEDLITTSQEEISDGFYRDLHEYVQGHDTTLVFTNTRSGAERVLHNLRRRYPDVYDESNSGCHHGSLSKSKRERVEEQLKSGDVDVVTSSTSLELGIDMPTLDLVVQVGSPKSVAALLQRVGRAGHQLGETVEGRMFVLDRDDLVECSVMIEKASQGFVDRVFPPERCHDVAAQHVYGMAIDGPKREETMKATLRRAHPYREYADEEWEELLRYLTLDYDAFEDKHVYAKVWRDENDAPGGEYHYEEFDAGETLIGKRGTARPIYMQNVGTIPDSFTLDVYTRGDDQWVGNLDEEYLNTLEKGDVFVLGGERYEYRYRRGSNAYVDRTSAAPTVPSWFSERLPLSYDLGREILDFQAEIVDRLRSGGEEAAAEWLADFPIDGNAVTALTDLFARQLEYAGAESVSTTRRLAVEEHVDRDEGQRHYYVHSVYGRKFNDGLSRVVAQRVADRAGTNVQVAVADNGFALSVPLHEHTEGSNRVDVADVVESLDPDAVADELRDALEGTEMLKRYFRIDASRALMILKYYKGSEKSASKQQVDSEMLLGTVEDLDDFAVLEETYRELMEDELNVDAVEEVLHELHADGNDFAVPQYEVPSPSPRAFGLATLRASDVVLAEDESEVLREFHENVTAAISDD